jgi:hypothetical protein
MTAKTLTIGIATRGRADLAALVAEQTRMCCSADTRIVVLADADDDLGLLPALRGITLSVAPRPDSVGAKWNRMAEVAPADVYMAMVDYRSQVTPGFDRKILDAANKFDDGIGAIYQHMANLSFPCYQAVTAKMFSIMEGIYPTIFPYWFADHWLDDVAKMIGRIAYAEGDTVVHPRPGAGTTQDFREPPFWGILYDVLAPERERIANDLLDAMNITDNQRDILRANWPLIHQRSLMINGMVRDMQETDTSRDDRYNRIRENALTIMRQYAPRYAA